MKIAILLLILAELGSSYHLGFFVPLKYEDPNYGIDTMSGNTYPHALTIAVDDVNNDPNILPGQNLTYSWTDSTDSETVLRTMYQKYISQRSTAVDAFIGPAFQCSAPAKVSGAFRIPMISYYCYEGEHFKKKDYPLFIQTFQNTNTQAASALFTLLIKQKWKRIGILYEEGSNYWIDLKTTILKRADKHGLRIVSLAVPNFKKFDSDGEHPGQFAPKVQRRHSLQKTRKVLKELANEKRLKIFVLLTTFEVLVEIMTEAYLMGLTELNRPHRAFIGFQLDAAKRRKTYSEQSQMFKSILHKPNENETRLLTMKGARSLLIISADEPKNTDRYNKFRTKLINRTTHALPFNDTTVYELPSDDINEIAPALYDAVYQYALAVDRLQKRNVTVTARAVVEEFRNTSYVGMSGYTSVFRAEDGTLQVHLSLLHLEKEVTRENYLKMNPNTIGSFNYNESSDIELEYYVSQISWPWGTTNPTDQLTCEDDNHECPNDKENGLISILPIVLSVVFVVIFFVLLALFLRQWRRERELKRSVWQIDIDEIVFDRKVSTESKFSDDSGIRSASDPELYSLLDDSSKDFFVNGAIADEIEESFSMKSFAPVKSTSGHYKGGRVYVKVLPRNVDITKPMQRELRMLRRIHHENLNAFIGLGTEASYIWIVMKLGSKGTLQEVLANPDISLDHRFILSLVYDIAKGMTFLHNSDIKSHGNLKSSNCIVDNRWVLKITDYGIPEVRSRQARYLGPSNEDKKYMDLLWKAPELLRETDPPLCGTRSGDVYSFSIILEEFHTFKSPYSNSTISARSIIDRIVDGEVPPYRPVVTQPIENAERLLDLMKDCWRENPEKRPSFQEIKCAVECSMTRCGLKTDICDNMITLLENYSNDLENVVSERTRQLRDEKYKTEALLDRMLPRSVADQLKRGETVQAESFSSVTVYFSDIVQFTALCAESTPMEVVDMLNDLYLLFDDIIIDYNVYKVETIGDAYMVVSGLPMRNGKLHASEICCMALEILDNVKSFKVRHKPEHELQVRIGIHTGPVVAGVVGMTMPRYCLFGDTVNTASRMESNGKALQIHVSESTKEVLDELGGFYLKQRSEKVLLKGKGCCTTFWLQGASPDVPRCPRKLSKKAMKPLFQNTASRKYSQPFRGGRKKAQAVFPRASVA